MFVLIENGIVTQVQHYDQEGFIEVPEGEFVVCGMHYDGEKFSLPPVDLDELKLRACRQVDDIRDHKIDTPYSFGGSEFQVRAGDRENIMGRMMEIMFSGMQGQQYPDFEWIANDNTHYEFTAQSFINFATELAHQKNYMTMQGRAVKDAILSCENEDQINAILDTASGAFN